MLVFVTIGILKSHKRVLNATSPLHETMALLSPTSSSTHVTTIHEEAELPSTKSFFLTAGHYEKDINQAYSGMWWQSTADFLHCDFETYFPILESASFNVFDYHEFGAKTPTYMTRDWLDFGVEHLSFLVRHLAQWQFDDAKSKNKTYPALQQLEGMLENYIAKQASEVSNVANEVLQQTLVIIPVRLHSVSHTLDRATLLQLAATLVSLYKNLGLRRAVIAGISFNEEAMTEEVRKLLRSAKVAMTVVYMECIPQTLLQRRKVPGIALAKLQRILKNPTSNETVHLLGNDPGNWKYIYFTEPDLLLSTRPKAIPMLTKALHDENACLSAHRWDVLPHEADFDTSFVKNKEILRAFVLPTDTFPSTTKLDSTVHSCCDQGSYFPANPSNTSTPALVRVETDKACDAVWLYCGFNNPTKQTHERLERYELFRLDRGLGLPVAHEHQRVCKVQNC